MIYYPLSVLMLADIREVAIIATPEYMEQFKWLLGDGSHWGMAFSYIEQPSPDGLAQAFILAEDFLDGAPSALVLGDNLFFRHDLPRLLKNADAKTTGGSVFGYRVTDPERYGVVGFDNSGNVSSIIEKPDQPASNYAITGLYFVDGMASARAKNVKPSSRGELEITSLLESYRIEGNLTVEKMGRGYAWLDTGTHDSLAEAGEFVKALEKRQGLKIGCIEENSLEQGFISKEQAMNLGNELSKTEYGQYLIKRAKQWK